MLINSSPKPKSKATETLPQRIGEKEANTMYKKEFTDFDAGIKELMTVSKSAAHSIRHVDEPETDAPWTEQQALGNLAHNYFYEDESSLIRCGLRVGRRAVEYRTGSGIRFGWYTYYKENEYQRSYTFFLINKHANPESTLRKSALAAGWQECTPADVTMDLTLTVYVPGGYGIQEVIDPEQLPVTA